MGANVEGMTNRIAASLRDANNDSWTEPAIHDAILEGERAIVIHRPDASSATKVLTCVAGPVQSIAGLSDPAPHRLLNIICNMSSGTPGRGINRTGIGDLDRIRPAWRGDNESGTIKEYMHDERNPLEFECYPPATVGTELKVLYAGLPSAYGTVDPNTETTISDIYDPHLIEWALYRLFGHDAEDSVNISRSQQHLKNFSNMLGIQMQGEKIASGKSLEHKR